MKKFYEALSEKDKRHYAGVEAMKLGHGGVGQSVSNYLLSVLVDYHQTPNTAYIQRQT